MNRWLNKYLVYYPAVLARRQWVPMHLHRLRCSQWLSGGELQAVQSAKLRRILSYARASVPYYREVLSGIDIEAIRGPEGLAAVPVLTKELLKARFDDLRAGRVSATIKKTTGGSTGNPVTIYKSADSVAAAYAAYWRGYEWAGVGIGDRQARFWGVPNGARAKTVAKWTDWITNRLRCSAFEFDDENLARYYEELNRFRPAYFYGYVSMLEAFARFLMRERLDLRFPLTAVITTSEVLTLPHRKLLQAAFRCPVFNEYGCGELGTIAHECEHGSMHISAENLIVEILRDGRPVQAGEQGDIVVTELNNTAMPLIRYNLKDLGYVAHGQCECGRGLPLMGEVTGRAYDVLYNREGRAFHGEYFMYLFEDLQRQGVEVTAFQVVQMDPVHFVIKLVMAAGKRPIAERYLLERVRSTYGSYAEIRYEYVESIDREPSGKMRLIKSMAPPPEQAEGGCRHLPETSTGEAS